MAVKIIHVPEFEVTINRELSRALTNCAALSYCSRCKQLNDVAGQKGKKLNGQFTIVAVRLEFEEVTTYRLTFREGDLWLKAMEAIHLVSNVRQQLLIPFRDELLTAMMESQRQSVVTEN